MVAEDLNAVIYFATRKMFWYDSFNTSYLPKQLQLYS
jgi:hypothetical protein